MKSIWWILSLLFGAFVFWVGCMFGGDKMQYVGAVFIFVGLLALLERIWPEDVEE